MKVRCSSPPGGGGRASPTYNAACDQVDCVRYLIATLMRLLPSTSSTSPGRRVRASKPGATVATSDPWRLGAAR